jgi:hypothetical protein
MPVPRWRAGPPPPRLQPLLPPPSPPLLALGPRFRAGLLQPRPPLERPWPPPLQLLLPAPVL